MEELDGTEKNTLKIFKNITLIHEVGMVLLEVRWSGPGLCSVQTGSLSLLWCPLSSPNSPLSFYSVSVDSKPSQWHVCWCCHHCSAGSPVKPKSSERSVFECCMNCWKHILKMLYFVYFINFVLISCDSICVLLTVMETQTAVMDMDVFQTRLGVMLQWVTLRLSCIPSCVNIKCYQI